MRSTGCRRMRSFDWTPYAAPYAWPGNTCLALLREVCLHVGSPVPPEFPLAMRMASEREARDHADRVYGGVLRGYAKVLEKQGWAIQPEGVELAPFDVVLGSALYGGGETAPQPLVVREDHRITGYTLAGLDTVDALLSVEGVLRCPQR